MRPPLSRTQTSACVVSVSTRAKSSPSTKSPVISDVEQRRFVELDGQPFRARVLGGQLGELLTGLPARLERVLVRPEGDDERPVALLVLEPDQAAVARRVAQPRPELLPEDPEAGLRLLRGPPPHLH